MSTARPINVLICALGGQGGGVLVEWLSEAAHLAGFPAQATSTPGVAQRTGGTTYYFELYPERAPAAEPVFCLFPSASEVNVVVALEPVEAARALHNGYIGRNTTVIALPGRVYAIGEKIIGGDGTLPAEAALESVRQVAGRLLVLDAPGRGEGQANALVFGALAAAGVLPLALDDCRRAIASVGISPRANLAGFERGTEAQTAAPPESMAMRESELLPCPAALLTALAALPKQHRPVIAHAAARLSDYQDFAYARRYLERLGAVALQDSAGPGLPSERTLTGIVARRLASWMMYEDVIRVAQLKTRPGRLKRIRAELGAGAAEPVAVTDILKPGGDELRSLLPQWLGRFVRPAKPGQRRGGIALKLPTSRPWGYATLKLLASLRRWRPYTTRFGEEDRAIDEWIAAIKATVPLDYALACRLAELAVLARGYGDVRVRGLRRLGGLLAGWSNRLSSDGTTLAREAASLLDAARNHPDAGSAPV